MSAAHSAILTLNGGSSSLRFALYEAGESLRLKMRGKAERIGLSGTNWLINDASGKISDRRPIDAANHSAAVTLLLEWLEAHHVLETVAAVGHRVVHGMTRTAPEEITPQLLAELRKIVPFDPEHLPAEIELIEALQKRLPRLPQVACFDTAFHRDMPPVAKALPIPRRYQSDGVQRYGFHGLSYAFLMEQLEQLGDPAATHDRVILAHLGNGASLAAVRDGKSIDTSMGFTPTAGLVMGSRTGDLDPGVMFYLAQREGMTAERLQRMVNHESGLLGVSETSSDVRDLLEREATDTRAAQAIELFCYQARKWIGAYIAALGGLQTLVFSGGIGENAPVIRARICEGLGPLGITLDRELNAAGSAVISTTTSRATVRVIHTDEELMIARSVSRLLQLGATKES